MFQAENAHARNPHVAKTTVSVSELEYLADKSVNVWIAETVSHTCTTVCKAVLEWNWSIATCRLVLWLDINKLLH